MIQIHLLGRFSASSGDGSPQNLRRKSECLICLLALSDGLEVTREMAAGLIWSANGRNLRSALTRCARKVTFWRLRRLPNQVTGPQQ